MSLKALLTEDALKTAETYKIKPETADEHYGMGSLESSKKKEYYPQITIESDDVPEVKEWNEDEDYVIVIRGTLVSMDSRSGKRRVTLDIKEIGVVNEEDEEENEDDDEDETSDDVKNYMKSM